MKKILCILSLCSLSNSSERTANLTLDSCRAMALKKQQTTECKQTKTRSGSQCPKGRPHKVSAKVDVLGGYQYFSKKYLCLMTIKNQH